MLKWIERLSFVDFQPCMLTKHVHDRQTDIYKVKKVILKLKIAACFILFSKKYTQFS